MLTLNTAPTARTPTGRSSAHYCRCPRARRVRRQQQRQRADPHGPAAEVTLSLTEDAPRRAASIDHGLIEDEERAVRSDENACSDIAAGKDQATVLRTAVLRFEGGAVPELSAAQGRRLVAAVEEFCQRTPARVPSAPAVVLPHCALEEADEAVPTVGAEDVTADGAACDRRPPSPTTTVAASSSPPASPRPSGVAPSPTNSFTSSAAPHRTARGSSPAGSASWTASPLAHHLRAARARAAVGARRAQAGRGLCVDVDMARARLATKDDQTGTACRARPRGPRARRGLTYRRRPVYFPV